MFGLDRRSDWLKGVDKDATNARDSLVSESGSDKGFMPSIKDNKESFKSRRGGTRGPTEKERWTRDLENYDVNVSFADVGHESSFDIDLKAEVEGLGSTDIESDELDSYLDEIDNKTTAVREQIRDAKEAREILHGGERDAEEGLLDELLTNVPADHSPEDVDSDRLNESRAGERTGNLNQSQDMTENGIELLDEHLGALRGLEAAYESHAAETAAQYHDDAKENIKKAAEGAQDMFNRFAETAEAASIVVERGLETVNHENYSQTLVEEDAARQEPVQEVAQEALETQLDVLAEYMEQIDQGVDQVEEAYDRFSEVLGEEEVDYMRETVEEYREGMSELAQNAVSEYVDVEEGKEVSEYVQEMVDYTGLEDDWQIREQGLDMSSRTEA
jgi:uncharacterized phage infection (PIP) family protein YhgE